MIDDWLTTSFPSFGLWKVCPLMRDGDRQPLIAPSLGHQVYLCGGTYSAFSIKCPFITQ